MQRRRFQGPEKPIIQEAVLIAEESTSDFFKLSNSQWRRSRYDILTLEALREEEISSSALAQLAKYTCCLPGRELKSAHFDLYRICLQDHNILSTLEKQTKLALLPLLIYVITHELVHIIRFSRFHQLFDATTEEKEQEEKRVHSLTREILRPYKCPDLAEISLHYHDHHS
jgi:hypothetical protein